MKVKKLTLILLAVMLTFSLAFTGCGNKPDSGDSNTDSGSSGGKVEAVLDGVEITKAPTKTTYIAGETFDKTGMVVSAHYSDGTLKPVTSYFIDKTGALTVDDTYVTITYNKYNAKQAITVKAVSLYSIDVESSDNKVYRYEAEKQNVSDWAYQSWNVNGFIMGDMPAASGGQYLGNLSCDINAQGRYNVVTVTVNSTVKAVAVLSFAYAGGEELGAGTFYEAMVMTWNEKEIAMPTDKSIQTAGWGSFEIYTISGLPLNVGVNTLQIKIIGGCPNIDYFEVEVNKDGVTVDESLFDVHHCSHVCEICGKCTDKNCDKPECSDKCAGHHQNGCESKCETCGKCTNQTCDNADCANKCQGHDFKILKDDVKVELAAIDALALFVNSGAGIENGRISSLWAIASKNITAKFTLNVEASGDYDLYISGAWGALDQIELSEVLPITLNGDTVEYSATTVYSGWNTDNIYKIATLSLNAGDNVFEMTVKGNMPNLAKIIFQKADAVITDMRIGSTDTEVTEKALVLFSEFLTAGAKEENGMIADVWKLVANSETGEFTVYAEEEITVEFFYTYGWSVEACNLSDKIELTLNGNAVTAGGDVVASDGSIINSVVLANMTLQKGVNTITLKILGTIPNMNTFGFKVVTAQAE